MQKYHNSSSLFQFFDQRLHNARLSQQLCKYWPFSEVLGQWGSETCPAEQLGTTKWQNTLLV